MVGSGGRYVEIGNISPGLTYAADPALWVTQNISIYGNNHYGRRHLRDALDLLARTSTRYPYDRIVSHKFPLAEINDAFAAAGQGHDHPLQSRPVAPDASAGCLLQAQHQLQRLLDEALRTPP